MGKLSLVVLSLIGGATQRIGPGFCLEFGFSFSFCWRWKFRLIFRRRILGIRVERSLWFGSRRCRGRFAGIGGFVGSFRHDWLEFLAEIPLRLDSKAFLIASLEYLPRFDQLLQLGSETPVARAQQGFNKKPLLTLRWLRRVSTSFQVRSTDENGRCANSTEMARLFLHVEISTDSTRKRSPVANSQHGSVGCGSE